MPTINLSVNGTDYSIDKAALAPAIAALHEYLLIYMSGSGATINFLGNSYSVDPTKLSSAIANFVNHLSTIEGEGVKIEIEDVEYSIDAEKLDGAISNMQTALDNLQSNVVESLSYEKNNENPAEYMITGIGNVSSGKVIPLKFYMGEDGTFYPVTRIHYEAFRDDSRIKYVEIPNSIKIINISAFQDCHGLETIKFEKGCSAQLSNYCFYLCSALKEISIPASITEVGDSVFRECSSLEKIVIHGTIGVRMCWGSEKLKEVYIGDEVTDIPERAFAYCSALDTVRMGKNVEFIGLQAFYETSLKEIDFSQHTFVPTLENAYAFKGIERIAVPANLYDEWIAADEWSRLAKRIVAV